MTIATISGPTMVTEPFNAIRRYFEAVGAVAVFALFAWQAPWFAEKFAAPVSPWSASGLYSGLFSWASIQTGFLFAVYTFIVPKSEPFVQAVSSTRAFKDFKRYMLKTVNLTFIVAIIALALMVTNPTPPPRGPGSLFLAGWVSLAAYSFLCFCKVIRTFRKLDRSS